MEAAHVEPAESIDWCVQFDACLAETAATTTATETAEPSAAALRRRWRICDDGDQASGVGTHHRRPIQEFGCTKVQAGALPSWLVLHRYRTRLELETAHEPQVNALRETCEQCRPMAHQCGMHNELVLIDQSQLRQRKRQLHASHEQSLAWLLLEPLDRGPQILLARAPRSSRRCRACSTRRTSLSRRWFGQTVPSTQASPTSRAAATLPASFRRSPGRRGAHRNARGSWSRDCATLRRRQTSDDRSIRLTSR